MKRDRTIGILTAVMVAMLVLAPTLPSWAMFLFTVSLCYGIVVLGMMLLIRTGLVSFGHGLYYCLGAYAAGTLEPLFGITELAIMLGSAIAVTAAISAVLALLLRKYRDIFFAMLSLASGAAGFFTNAGVVGLYALFVHSYPTHVRASGTGFSIGIGRGGAMLSPTLTP